MDNTPLQYTALHCSTVHCTALHCLSLCHRFLSPRHRNKSGKSSGGSSPAPSNRFLPILSLSVPSIPISPILNTAPNKFKLKGEAPGRQNVPQKKMVFGLKQNSKNFTSMYFIEKFGRHPFFVFTELAPLGRFSHRVAMSVCLCVCLFAPLDAVFF